MSANAEIPSADSDLQIAARWRPLILSVLVLAFVLRLAAAVMIDRHVTAAGRDFFVEGDANGYWHLAGTIAAGKEYAIHTPPRRILRTPGFPLLLAACRSIWGDNIFAARCVLAGVGTLCCWLTWRLGSRLVMRRVGFWAALLMAVHPLQIVNSVLILSETWFTLWMLAALLTLTRLVDGPQGRPQEDLSLRGSTGLRAFVTGVLMGVTVLIRPGFLPWLPVTLLAAALLLKCSWRDRMLLAATVLIGFGLTMTPWVLRNHQVSGHWVLTALWSGPSMYDGLNPEADGGSNMRFFDQENVLSHMSEYEMNQHYQQRAIKYAQENPGRAAELAVLKMARFLQPVPGTAGAGWAIWAACSVIYGGMLMLLVQGIRSRLLDPCGLLVTLGPFLLFLAVHMVFVGSLRYRLPVEFPLAVVVATGLRQWLPGRSSQAETPNSESPAC